MPNVHTSHDGCITNHAPLEIIVSEGAPYDFFYVILEGTVEISQNMQVIRTLRDGDVFGLENYYRARPYTTTATAITPARIAAYHSETVRDIIFTHPRLTEQIFSSVMGQLEQTTERALEHIAFELPTPFLERIYHDGETIVTENTQGTEIYRLIEAQHGLRVTFQGRDIATITRPGQLFGAMGPILNQPRSATVTSVGRSSVQVISATGIVDEIARNPNLAIEIINCLSECLREANRRLAGTTSAEPNSNDS